MHEFRHLTPALMPLGKLFSALVSAKYHFQTTRPREQSRKLILAQGRVHVILLWDYILLQHGDRVY